MQHHGNEHWLPPSPARYALYRKYRLELRRDSCSTPAQAGIVFSAACVTQGGVGGGRHKVFRNNVFILASRPPIPGSFRPPKGKTRSHYRIRPSGKNGRAYPPICAGLDQGKNPSGPLVILSSQTFLHIFSWVHGTPRSTDYHIFAKAFCVLAAIMEVRIVAPRADTAFHGATCAV